jgi:hydroxymethylglutaryl-CoA lyase
MGFGNPYGDPWSPEIVTEFTHALADMGVRIVALSDTVGISSPELITPLFSQLIPAFPQVEFGAHLHTPPATWREKVAAAFAAGCRRFDGAIGGIGGCPMAANTLTGNMPTENLIAYLEEQDLALKLNKAAFSEARSMAAKAFHLAPSS